MKTESRTRRLAWPAFGAANGLVFLGVFFNPIGALGAGACLAVAAASAAGARRLAVLILAIPIGGMIGFALWFGLGGTW
jgi:hypothetical protein